MKRVYLDHAATTPLLLEARAAMEPWLAVAANPSSLHVEGRAARDAVDQAREVVAEAFGCLFGEVVFTSSGTEAANLAIVGAALGVADPARRRVLFGAAEHHCVLHTQPLLERLGFRVETLPVDRYARVSPETLANRLGPDVALVSVMHANNELGTVNPVPELARLAREAGALLHTDAVQTFPFSGTMGDLGVDLMSVAAHKLYGPRGAGALAVRSGVEVRPLSLGGGQEREMRAGTEDVAAIVGFSAAVSWCRANRARVESRKAARDAFWAELAPTGRFDPTVAAGVPCLSGHCHVRVPGVSAETLLIRLDRAGVSSSSGAACSSGSLLPSHVLLATGLSEAEAREGLRFTFGKDSTPDEARLAAQVLVNEVDAVLAARSDRV